MTAPKTLSSVRTIEIDNSTLNILMNYMTASETIFDISMRNLNYHLKKLNVSTHIFRHTHVALLIESGVPIKVISERLGHSNINTTLNIYTHVTANMKLDLRSKLDKLCADFTQK